MRNKLESYLIETFNSMQTKSSTTPSKITCDQISILLLADQYDLNNLYSHIMSKYPALDPKEMNENPSFPKLKSLTQYELIRNTLMDKFRSKKSHLPEVKDIFRFLDIFLYEGRIVDLSVQKPFERVLSFRYDPNEKDKFLSKPADKNFAVLLVDGIRLYVDSSLFYMLIVLSSRGRPKN